MASYFGNHIHISIFGQSHSEAIGVTVDGLPAGEAVDLEQLQAFLRRRAPGRDATSTPRKEGDVPRILCGLVEGMTCGAPLTAVIENTNTRSRDYDELRDKPRPSHADLTAHIKYGGFQDVRGGGHFSGRLTAPLCIAGGICAQLLARRGIAVAAISAPSPRWRTGPSPPGRDAGHPAGGTARPLPRFGGEGRREDAGGDPPGPGGGGLGGRCGGMYGHRPARPGWAALCFRGWRVNWPPPCLPSLR